jgi:hypothetical protein
MGILKLSFYFKLKYLYNPASLCTCAFAPSDTTGMFGYLPYIIRMVEYNIVKRTPMYNVVEKRLPGKLSRNIGGRNI